MHYYLGDIEIIALSSKNNLPPEVKVVVYEQDTDLLLTPTDELREPAETVTEILAQKRKRKTFQPGCILVKEQLPLCFFAIIYDFDKDPLGQVDWIKKALHNVIKESERRQLDSIALPLLGSSLKIVEPYYSLQLIEYTVENIAPIHLSRIWLIEDSRIANV